MKHEFKHVDVQAVSFALYESFYETIPNLTVNLYGMSYSTWNKYMPEDDVYSINDTKAMMSALAEIIIQTVINLPAGKLIRAVYIIWITVSITRITDISSYS